MAISYKLPKLKERDEEKEESIGYEGMYPDSYDRRIRIPLNREQVEALSVGDEEVVTLRGTVQELENVESDQEYNRTSLTIQIESVEVAAKNEFEKLSEDE